MDITISNKEFPYILVDNFYDESELKEIWEELDYLCHPRRMARSSIENGAAWEGFDESGNKNLLNHNWTMWLDDLFGPNREKSNILCANRKVFANMHMFDAHPHWALSDTYSFKTDFTQIGYYENNDQYRVHRDSAKGTCLTWVYREPKRYTGGNLRFPMWDIEIECKNNRLLCFPSSVPHQATKVSMEEQYRGKKLGRFVMTQFLDVAQIPSNMI